MIFIFCAQHYSQSYQCLDKHLFIWVEDEEKRDVEDHEMVWQALDYQATDSGQFAHSRRIMLEGL